ncbi:MAG: M13 family metallopeptidase [Crocinitomicaceae bacterium]|nr:M13 family metallopeptidase [Crocinitomicaceae bacterium]
MKKNTIIALSIGAVVLIACDVVKETTEEIAEEAVTSVVGETIDIDYMDQATRPQDDFFQFANGTWTKNNPVPASESRWGSFNELDQANKAKLTKILEIAKDDKDAAKGSTNQILGDYYESYMNLQVRNQKGVEVIENELVRIDKMNSKKDLVYVVAEHHQMGINTLFGFGVGQDLKNVDYHISYMGQGGMGLPNKDYYFSDDKAEIREQYVIHISGMMELCGMKNSDAMNFAEGVLEFEKTLAEGAMTPAERRIPENTYNKRSRDKMTTRSEGFELENYFSLVGSNSFDSLIVGQVKFMDGVFQQVKNTPLQQWKNYLKWKVVDHYAGHMNEKFIEKNFAFYGTVLSGKKEMKPLNERAIDEITRMTFSEVLGKAFVEKHYSDEAQQRVNTMVDNLLIVFRERIEGLDWMSATTKKEALNKLNSIGRKLGFPSKWEDFSALNFTPENYVENIREMARYDHKKNMAKLDAPVDKDEWGMPAHMVNAYYHPLLNEIAFPAGIMQAPFFSDQYEDAVNYSRIGMVIGHEFTHGFDDMGSKFAADGSFKNWWTESDRNLFEERTSKLGATFSGFCPIDGHCVNPDLTMGENIADLGGLTLAYYAYKRTVEYQSGVKKKGYTPSQRFFIGFAQLWKINYTDEELKNRIANDPHSPGMYRVNGPLMNCPEFFEAFDVKEGDPMRNSSETISKIW